MTLTDLTPSTVSCKKISVMETYSRAFELLDFSLKGVVSALAGLCQVEMKLDEGPLVPGYNRKFWRYLSESQKNPDLNQGTLVDF